MLKNGLPHQIKVKQEEADPFLQERTKKKIILIKDEGEVKIITQFAATAPKTYCYRAQKDDHKIEDCEFIKATAVKKSTSKAKL